MVKEEMGRIHAWSLRCYTPEEWEERKRKEEKEGEGEGAG
jgi:acid stress-induced BolA-like protein IbaG/YrbA